MENEFVTYTIALKLKELGFNKPCLRYYALEYSDYFGGREGVVDLIDYDTMVLRERKELSYKYTDAPLWQQAIDFMRENKKIHISLPNHYDGNSIDVRNFNNDTSYHSLNEDKWYEDYYEAREIAILKSFELF